MYLNFILYVKCLYVIWSVLFVIFYIILFLGTTSKHHFYLKKGSFEQ